MAHKLEIKNGAASMFSVKETPWHKLGAVLPEAPSMEQALQLAKLDWEVALKPLYAAPTELTEALANRTPDNFVAAAALERVAANGVFRTDTGAFLGAVGPRYEPLQNNKAFHVFEPLLDEGLATIETGGVLRAGKDVWMLVRFLPEKLGGSTQEWLDEEGVAPYGLLTNNHSGWSAVRMGMTPVRVVCWNTLSAALMGEGVLRVPHVGNVEAKLAAAAEDAFAAVVKRYNKLSGLFRALRRTALDDKLFERLVLNSAAPLPHAKKGESEAEAAERARDRTLDRRDAIRAAWTAGVGHLGDRSAFEAFSGLVEVLDHSALYEGRRASRVESMALGQLSGIKNRVFKALVKASAN